MTIPWTLAVAWAGFWLGVAVTVAVGKPRTPVILPNENHTPDDCTCCWYEPGTALHGIEGGSSVVYAGAGWVRRVSDDCPEHSAGVGA